MRVKIAQSCVWIGVLLLACGAGVCGPCDPKLEVLWTDVAPPDGSSVAGPSATIVVTGTEEKHLSVNYGLTFSLQKRNPDGSWSYAAAPSSVQSSGWSVGTPGCSEIQTNVLTFENVPLGTGANTFRVKTLVTWYDSEAKASLDETPFTLNRAP